ncbi:recombination protein RecR [bacterium]|nr:recombination protein RecR [bacterium]
MIYSREIQDLVEIFSHFPGIGPKAAQRFVFYLLRQPAKNRAEFIERLKSLENIYSCSICHNFSNYKICPICQDSQRDHSIVLIVARPQDLMAIEKMGHYKGLYHVLERELEPIEQANFAKIITNNLLTRLKKNKEIKELIFGFDLNIKGEGMTLYISNLIKQDSELKKRLKLSKMARGLPLGAEIEYADEITLGDALKNRKNI